MLSTICRACKVLTFTTTGPARLAVIRVGSSGMATRARTRASAGLVDGQGLGVLVAQGHHVVRLDGLHVDANERDVLPVHGLEEFQRVAVLGFVQAVGLEGRIADEPVGEADVDVILRHGYSRTNGETSSPPALPTMPPAGPGGSADWAWTVPGLPWIWADAPGGR